MFAKFKYERIPLSLIKLDARNPRIVTQSKPTSDEEILNYFFEHENLGGFLKKISSEGRNKGAERPYVVKSGKEYVVIEGNTRIASYKLLTGQLTAPKQYTSLVPHIPVSMKEDLLSVDCAIAPSRDALLSIMANAHFGLGDKSRWGYLGSRKAVYDEWKAGKSIAQLASAFDRKPGQIRDLLLEYAIYLEALDFDWTPAEKEALLSPELEFNPPVRFLQSSGHKALIGIELDRTNLVVNFNAPDAKAKLKHLVKKLVINTGTGLSATSLYKDVFVDFATPLPGSSSANASGEPTTGGQGTSTSSPQGGNSSGKEQGGIGKPPGSNPGTKLKSGTLFNYPISSNNSVLKQLMKEASTLNTQNFPGAGTSLLRGLVEAILKAAIHDQGANPQNKLLSLETALDICLSQAVTFNQDDKKILKEFKKTHLDYVNMGTHATVVPNTLRLVAARDCIDQFIMRNV